MISLLAFIVLNIYFFVFMNRYAVRVKHPMNKTQTLLYEGMEAFLILLFATGSMAMSSSGGGHGASGGFNLQAIRLLLLEAVLVLALFRSTKKMQWGIGTYAYLIYMLWLLYSMTYTEAGQYGWRYILKYVYPLCIMAGASAIVRDEEVFVTIMIWARRVAIASLVAYFVPVLNNFLGGLFWYDAALNIHYATIVCISLTLFFGYGKKVQDLVLAFIFVAPCIIQVHRTGLMCIGGAIGAYCFFKFKWVSLPYLALVGASMLAIIFYVPSFHEKMFWKDSEGTLTIQDLREGNIEEDDIRNNGREAIWDLLKANFYEGHELKGSGIGSCQKFLYEAGPTFVKQTHGDYVQIKCDTGNIGFYLYLSILAVIVIHCMIECFNPDNPPYVQYCAMIAGAALVGNYLAMYSDNAVTYTMATTGYPFGFYGILLGLKAKFRGE